MFRERNRRDPGRAPDGAPDAKERTTMKEKPNYAELEKRIDFTALAGRLGQLTEQDNPQRKTVFTLLDKVREPILAGPAHAQRELSGAGQRVDQRRNPGERADAAKISFARRAWRRSHARRLRRKPAMATASPQRQRRAPKPNRRRRPGSTVSISTCDRHKARSTGRPVPVMPLARGKRHASNAPAA